MVAVALEEVLVDLLLVVEGVVRLELVVEVLLVDVEELELDDVLLVTSRAPSIVIVAAEGLSIEYLR